MELNRENIIKALELHANAEKSCVDECPYGNMRRCGSAMATDALSLINELTEENKAWQKQLIALKEQADKAYYDCAVEDLRAENERLRVENTLMINIMCADIGDYPEKTCRMRINLPTEYLSKDNHSPQTEYEIGEKALKKSVEQVKAGTVRKMQERLHERKVSYGNITFRVVPIDDIDQIAEEMVEGIE